MSFAKVNKAILKISGTQTKELLNGIITQNIEIITTNKPIYTLLLNNKGRVLYSTIIYMLDQNNYALEIEPELLMNLAKHIHKHDISKTVEFNQLDDMCIAISNKQEEGLYQDPRNNKLPYRGIIKNDFTHDQTLLDDYENARLEFAIPENYDFIREKTIANDLNLEQLNGVSFNKGCYLGQELTSRNKHIKASKNQLISLKNTYNVTKNNMEVFDNKGNKLGDTFSHNSKFVLAIIKRGSLMENIIIK